MASRLKVKLIAEPDSPLLERVTRWGGDAVVTSLEEWLAGAQQPELLIFDLTADLTPQLAGRIIHGLKEAGATAVWVVGSPVPEELPDAATGALPLLFWKAAPDSVGAWTLQQAERLRCQRRDWEKSMAEARAFQDLASGLSIGLFRFRLVYGRTITLEYFSPRAEVLTGLSFSELSTNPDLLFEGVLPEDRGPLRSLMESLRETPRTDEVKIRMNLVPRMRTLRVRFDVPLPGPLGFLYQGMIEDVTEDVKRSQHGERAMELLWQIKENLNFLDVVEPMYGSNDLLSPREGEVYQLLRVGMSNALIAARLGCKESTVKKHVSAIFDKKGVNSRAQLLSLDQ